MDSPSGFAGQSRAPRKPGIDLDDVVLLGQWVQRVLDVALTDHAKVPAIKGDMLWSSQTLKACYSSTAKFKTNTTYFIQAAAT